MDKYKSFSTLDSALVENIKEIIKQARQSVSSKINHVLILSYWRIGESIVLNEKENNTDSKTSRQIILKLSKKLSVELGRGFSRSNLFNMRKFYLEYPSVQTVSGHLSW